MQAGWNQNREIGLTSGAINVHKPNATFFLGTHRTGTSALAGFFQLHYPEILALHHLPRHRWVNVLTTLYLEQRISYRFFEKMCSQLLGRYIDQFSNRDYLETTAFSYFAADSVNLSHHRKRLVHVVRDPRTWIISRLNWTSSVGKSQLAHRYIPFWNPRGDKVGCYDSKTWAQLNELERTAWLWKYKNDLIEQTYLKSEYDVHLLLFEDFVNPEKVVTTLNRLFDFLGLESKPDEQIREYFRSKKHQNSSPSRVYPPWDGLPEQQQSSLIEICGESMRRFGYR